MFPRDKHKEEFRGRKINIASSGSGVPRVLGSISTPRRDAPGTSHRRGQKENALFRHWLLASLESEQRDEKRGAEGKGVRLCTIPEDAELHRAETEVLVWKGKEKTEKEGKETIMKKKKKTLLPTKARWKCLLRKLKKEKKGRKKRKI